jgi:hypothetical protein
MSVMSLKHVMGRQKPVRQMTSKRTERAVAQRRTLAMSLKHVMGRQKPVRQMTLPPEEQPAALQQTFAISLRCSG